nr:hypothetical protein CFP56_01134 [Quercus suber]
MVEVMTRSAMVTIRSSRTTDAQSRLPTASTHGLAISCGNWIRKGPVLKDYAKRQKRDTVIAIWWTN